MVFNVENHQFSPHPYWFNRLNRRRKPLNRLGWGLKVAEIGVFERLIASTGGSIQHFAVFYPKNVDSGANWNLGPQKCENLPRWTFLTLGIPSIQFPDQICNISPNNILFKRSAIPLNANPGIFQDYGYIQIHHGLAPSVWQDPNRNWWFSTSI